MKIFEVRLWYPAPGARGGVDRWRMGLAHFERCNMANQDFAPCVVVYRAPKGLGGTLFSWASHIHGQLSPLEKGYFGRVVPLHPPLSHNPASWETQPARFAEQLEFPVSRRARSMAPRRTAALPHFFALKNGDHPNHHWLDDECVKQLRVARDALLESGADLQQQGRLEFHGQKLLELRARRHLAAPLRLPCEVVAMSSRWAEFRREVLKSSPATVITESNASGVFA